MTNLPVDTPTYYFISKIILFGNRPGETVSNAAKRLGIGRPALSKVLNGKAELSIDLALKIEKHYYYAAEPLLIHQLKRRILQTKRDNSTPLPDYSMIWK